jgi:serine/threonine protein kinase
VMLYQALSGKLPFSGSLWEILQAKQTCDPPPLTADAATPTDLASLTMQLLARDLLQRPDAFEIVKRIFAGIGPASTVSTSPRDRHLVGRESHLAALKEVYRSMRRSGDPQTVFIVGR